MQSGFGRPGRYPHVGVLRMPMPPSFRLSRRSKSVAAQEINCWNADPGSCSRPPGPGTSEDPMLVPTHCRWAAQEKGHRRVRMTGRSPLAEGKGVLVWWYPNPGLCRAYLTVGSGHEQCREGVATFPDSGAAALVADPERPGPIPPYSRRPRRRLWRGTATRRWCRYRPQWRPLNPRPGDLQSAGRCRAPWPLCAR